MNLHSKCNANNVPVTLGRVQVIFPCKTSLNPIIFVYDIQPEIAITYLNFIRLKCFYSCIDFLNLTNNVFYETPVLIHLLNHLKLVVKVPCMLFLCMSHI